jgi:hypothetical protein
LALKRVDLSSNALETLSPETLRWEMLEFLNLAGNPWNCNCALLSFMPSVLRRIKRSGNRAVCVQPEQMSNVELANAVSCFVYCYDYDFLHNCTNKKQRVFLFDTPSASSSIFAQIRLLIFLRHSLTPASPNMPCYGLKKSSNIK